MRPRPKEKMKTMMEKLEQRSLPELPGAALPAWTRPGITDPGVQWNLGAGVQCRYTSCHQKGAVLMIEQPTRRGSVTVYLEAGEHGAMSDQQLENKIALLLNRGRAIATAPNPPGPPAVLDSRGRRAKNP